MMVPFSEIVADARRNIDRDHAAQDREECRVMVLAHAPDFSVEDRAQMIAALMGGQPPASVNAGLLQAAENAVPMMQMAWQQYGVGGMFEAMDALRAAISAARAAGGGA